MLSFRFQVTIHFIKMKYTDTRIRFRSIIVLLAVGWWYYAAYSAPITFKFPLHGQASWYSRSDPGVQKTTANNEPFNDQGMTAAIWGVRFGTHLRVTNKANGKSVVVRVNDRGPHRRFIRQGRVIDLTKAAFQMISSTKTGLIDVLVEKL